MPKTRRRAREAALKALYELEIGRTRILDSVTGMKANNPELTPELMDFAEQVVRGVYDKQVFLDDRLAAAIKDWDFDRIAAVDRNLMRIAAYELFYCPDIPPLVTINEAIELAKKYSTAESGKFVNGVLARVMQESPKAKWDPSQHVRAEVEEAAEEEPEPEVEVEEVHENTPEAEELSRIGLWKIRSGEDKA